MNDKILCPLCHEQASITPAADYQRLVDAKGKASLYIRCYKCKLDMYDNTDADFGEKLKNLTEKWERLSTRE